MSECQIKITDQCGPTEKDLIELKENQYSRFVTPDVGQIKYWGGMFSVVICEEIRELLEPATWHHRDMMKVIEFWHELRDRSEHMDSKQRDELQREKINFENERISRNKEPEPNEEIVREQFMPEIDWNKEREQ